MRPEVLGELGDVPGLRRTAARRTPPRGGQEGAEEAGGSRALVPART
ncbi:hypothetical protein LT493_34510 [Streptomyces tricolor]|nr:hypothetical protein [Streptomyces tricolor]